MNLTTTNRPLTMSTREIAALTGMEHQDLLIGTVEMLNELGELESTLNAAHRTTDDCIDSIDLPKDQTLVLLLGMPGLSTAQQFRVVARWQELEKASKAARQPRTVSQALRVAYEHAILVEQAIEQAQTLPVGACESWL